MAGYNPLSYFSFGKKKDATSASATPRLGVGAARACAFLPVVHPGYVLRWSPLHPVARRRFTITRLRSTSRS